MWEQIEKDKLYDEFLDVLIFAGGEAFIGEFEDIKGKIDKKTIVMCADSGLESCMMYDIHPQYVLGDMDSVNLDTLNKIKESRDVHIETFDVDKDFTDLELVLLKAVDFDVTNVCIIGALGGRIDQTLANIAMVCRFAQEYGLRIKLCGKSEDVYILTSFSNEICIKGLKGHTLSLMAASEKVSGIDLNGLKYPLNNATLTYGQTLGISNKFEENIVSVSMDSGTLIVIHEKHLGL